MRRLVRLALLLSPLLLRAVPLPRNYAVEHYEVTITPDLAQKRLTGEVTIRLHSRIERLEALELDAGGLTVSSVSDNQEPQWFERKGALLIVILTKPLHSEEQRTLVIRYQAGPAKGLVFYPDQVYTSFFTSDWMVCNDRPDEPATLQLHVSTPQAWKVAATEHLDSPAPPFLYAFAAGAFQEATSEVNGVKLRVLGPASVFDETSAALRFIAARTGHLYPGGVYTQVFVHGTVEQEAVGMTLLPEQYAAGLAAHPDDLWLLAHELAHQWYGVGIQCKDWSDFWLNEGLATFLADAFLEQRFGKARYDREIERSREIYETLKSEGKDRPLSFSDWQTPQQAGGQIPYHKGAWVLAQLRRQLTDEVFWRGLSRYTREYWGQRVTSENFIQAMTSAAGKSAGGKSLAKFFERWVLS
ncbi:MAG TPA: M1 family aminopeptidase [Bryobacteraceae bacterium]|nr:M1 family aminopeptidase [Bryobacteraceae bacterium]